MVQLSRMVTMAALCLASGVACGYVDDSSPPTARPSAATATPPPLSTERFTELGREASALIGAGDAAQLWDRFDSPLREIIGSLEDYEVELSALEESYGTQGERLSESIEQREGVNTYRATYRYSKVEAPVGITIAFRGDGQITELEIAPFVSGSAD